MRKGVRKAFRFTLVFTIVFSWVFSGFPHLMLVPSGNQQQLTQTRVARIINVAHADTSGPNSAGTAASASATCSDNMNCSVASTDLTANDTSYVSYSGGNWDNANPTDEVRASNFGFSLGDAATITGITVEVLGWTPAGGGTYRDVILFTAPGTPVGDDKAAGSLPTSDPGSTYQSFGGVADTWNAGLTVAQVNSSDFGVSLCWTATANNSTANIDHVRITITYIEPKRKIRLFEGFRIKFFDGRIRLYQN